MKILPFTYTDDRKLSSIQQLSNVRRLLYGYHLKESGMSIEILSWDNIE